MPTTRTNLRRPVRKQPYKKTMLVVHDSGMLPEYLRWVCQRLNHTHIVLESISEDELALVLERISSERHVAKKKTAEYDEVWLALEPMQHPEAFDLQGEDIPAGVQVAVVPGTTEHWILSHFEAVEAKLPLEKVRLRLARVLPQSPGGLFFAPSKLEGRYETARNAHPVPPMPLKPISAVIDSIRQSQQLSEGSREAPSL